MCGSDGSPFPGQLALRAHAGTPEMGHHRTYELGLNPHTEGFFSVSYLRALGWIKNYENVVLLLRDP